MKNKLQNLNDLLFLQLERLTDEDLAADKLAAEVQRSDAASRLAAQIIGNAKLALDAQRAWAEGQIDRPLPLLEDRSAQ